MNLTESQGKQLFVKYGLPVPTALLAHSAAEAETFADQLDSPKIVLKAQVPFGHRKKLGGIFIVNKNKVTRRANQLLGTTLKGAQVREILVEQYIELEQEWYLALVLNRRERRFEVMFSKKGGIDIESVRSNKIINIPLPLTNLARTDLATALKKNIDQLDGLIRLIDKLSLLLREQDATLVEVNPLGLDTDGKLWLLDSKITLDSSAAFRHADWPTLPREEFAFVALDGTIGVIGNGAGLVMATVDVLTQQKLPPANFLDVGGGADQQRMLAALGRVFDQPNLQAVFLNIFGGITRTDEIARGIQAYLSAHPKHVPLVARLVGTKQKEGRAILEQAGVAVFTDMHQAIVALKKEVANVDQ
ncbi:MAG: acetate--CoA ligase family protein [bacterium]|nr:acetate--CoA ligase family protein [bacterium]